MIGRDKLDHFFKSYLLLIPLVLFFGNFVGGILLVCIAAAKELIYDGLMNKGKKELWDFIFGISPIALNCILLKVKNVYLYKELLILFEFL